MSRRRYYSTYGRASEARRGPNVIPYVVIALLALLAWMAMRNMELLEPPVQITVSGRLTDAYSGEPIAGARVEVREAREPGGMAGAPGQSGVIVPGGNITVAGAQTATLPLQPAPAPILTTTTDLAGAFLLQNLPAGAWLHVEQPGYAPEDLLVGDRTTFEIALVPNVLRGKVLDAEGRPVSRAHVYSGGSLALSEPDGSFVLENLPERKLLVKAPGYRLERIDFGKVSELTVELDSFDAKAVYVNADTVASPGKFYGLIQLVEDTELDAMVIDVKADTTGYVLYDSKLPEVHAMGASNPVIPDLKAVVDTLHERNIYVIARQALFWDERLAEARPDLAIRSKSTGQPWQDAYNHRWANPRSPEVWAYNLAIAKEVAAFGVDEIQFDYVRFPSDGDLADADYGPTEGTTRGQAISNFLQRAYAELSPLGVFIAADVFGLSPIVADDLGIGQQWEVISAEVDYICPMAYPSHYAQGFLGFEQPAEHPGEVVGYTIEQGLAKGIGKRARIRPWLQDFTIYGVTYDASRVRGQIQVSEELGTSGWMLWNFDNVYTEDALKKE